MFLYSVFVLSGFVNGAFVSCVLRVLLYYNNSIVAYQEMFGLIQANKDHSNTCSAHSLCLL